MRVLLCLVLLLFTVATCHAAPAPYWQLGHGAYAPYLANAVEACGELDLARWDWLVVEIGSEDTIKLMNRLLEINPKLKFLARVWPINGMGDPEFRVAQGTCLDYTLYPEKREEIDRRLRDAIRQLKAGISNWDSIACFTFLEEIPGAWGCGELLPYTGEGPLPRTLEFHKTAIGKSRGKPLVWDAETKQWLGQQFVASMDSVHRIIKQESGGKLVFYWHHTNFGTLDDLPTPRLADFDLVKWGGYPVYFKDLIKPGLCDGFMAYPNNAKIWEEKYLRHVRENKWLFYSQLSHPSFMRLCSWPDAVQMVTNKLPQNLGYFLYCEGSCAAKGVWNDDQTMPKDPSWNAGWTSEALHLRHVAKQFNVGVDVVRRYKHLQVSLDANLGTPKAGQIFHLVALVENPKEATFYNDPAEAVAKDVRVKLLLPPGVVNDQRISAASDLQIGDLPAQGRRLADWWLTVKDPAALAAGKPIVVQATSANSDLGSCETACEVAFPSLQPHAITMSGATWTENGYRNGGLRPLIEIAAQDQPVKNPSLTDGQNTISYAGEFWGGMRLVITPDLKARLYPDNLLPQAADQLKDTADPTGNKSFGEGYGVHSANIGRYVRPGGRYRLTISGKAEGGAQSLVVLRAQKTAGGVWQESFLANRFTDQWAEASQEIEIPADVTSLERIYFYRFNQKGRVWYGPVSLIPADLAAEGLDVSDKLSGRPLQIGQGMLTDITYRDESPDAVRAKVIVTLANPAAIGGKAVQQGF